MVDTMGMQEQASVVLGPDDFYSIQSLLDGRFKMGRSKAGRGFVRARSHETGLGGPALLVGHAANVPGDFEKQVFADLHEYRVTHPRRSARPYEIFVYNKRVARYVCSQMLKSQGFRLVEKPWDPYAESCRQWQERIVLLQANSVAAVAAAHNLRMDAYVQAVANAGGPREGWTLADSVSGRDGFVRRDIFVDKTRPLFEDTHRPPTLNKLVCELTVSRRPLRTVMFFVFADAMRRYGMEPHPDAIESGIPWLRDIERTGRKPPRRSVVVGPSGPVWMPPDADQRDLFVP